MTNPTPERPDEDRPDPYTIELALAAALSQITDARGEAIARAWAAAWAETASDLRDALEVVLVDAGKVNTMAVVRYERLAQTLASIADHLEELVEDLGVEVTEDLAEVIDLATSGSIDLIKAQLPEPAQLPDLPAPPDALQVIVERTTHQVTSTALPLADETYAVILRELTRGVAAGDNPREVANRMVERAEDHHNFGRARAENIARTEILDAYREAARLQQLQQADVLAGWVWMAHLGPRTCPACLAKHGELHPLEEPGPLGHQQCRCSRTPVVREADGSADLSWMPSSREHFDNLPEADQVAIMGPERLALLREGLVTWEELATRRSTEGWRDSYVVTPLSELRKLAEKRRAERDGPSSLAS